MPWTELFKGLFRALASLRKPKSMAQALSEHEQRVAADKEETARQIREKFPDVDLD